MTSLAPEPAAPATDHGDDLAHALCPCYPDVALCGVNIAGWVQLDGGDGPPADACVVCLDLDAQPCPRCGL